MWRCVLSVSNHPLCTNHCKHTECQSTKQRGLNLEHLNCYLFRLLNRHCTLVRKYHNKTRFDLSHQSLKTTSPFKYTFVLHTRRWHNQNYINVKRCKTQVKAKKLGLHLCNSVKSNNLWLTNTINLFALHFFQKKYKKKLLCLLLCSHEIQCIYHQ